MSGPDDTEPLLAVCDELLALDQPARARFSIEAYSARLGAQLYRGEIAEIDHTIELIGNISRAMHLPESTWYYDRQRAQRLLARGDFAGAHAACDDLLARSKRMRLSYGEMFVSGMRSLLTIEERGLSAFAATWSSIALTSDGPNLAPHVRARLVRVGADTGRRESAKAGLDVLAAQGFETIPKDICYLNTLSNIALAAIALDDRDRAEQVYALLAPYPEHNTPDQLLNDMGSVSRYLGLLAAYLGRDTRVEAHFEQAVTMNRRMNRGPQLGRAHATSTPAGSRASARTCAAASKSSAAKRDRSRRRWA